MKKMFYVLLALLVSMVLVFGVSCDNSNKAPGGAEGNPPVEEPGTDVPGGEVDPKPEEPGDEESGNLGTDAVKVPEWANGTYAFGEDVTAGTLFIGDGNFKVNVVGQDFIDSSNPEVLGGIEFQNDDQVNKEYILVAVLYKMGDTEPSSFKMEMQDNGNLILTITTENSLINAFIKEPLICIPSPK